MENKFKNLTVSEAMLRFKKNDRMYEELHSASYMLNKMIMAVASAGNSYSEEDYDTIEKFSKLIEKNIAALEVENRQLEKIITDGK